VIFNDILQPTHLLLILVVALLVLGPKRLPEATRSIGRGIHDFKSAITGESPPGDRAATEAPARESGEPTV
jgi:sec-independent protein translocase protein TatA